MIEGLGVGVGIALGLVVIPIALLLGMCAIGALFSILYYALVAVAYIPRRIFDYIQNKKVNEIPEEVN